MRELSDLIRSAQNGDPESIDQLIAQFSGTINGECRRFALWEHPEVSLTDLEQEVLFRVWSRLDQFRGGESELLIQVFRAWLRKTARSVLSNLLRFQSAKKRKPGAVFQLFEDGQQAHNGSGGRTPSSIFLANEDAEQLQQIMKTCLDQQSQKILWMRIVDGQSIKKIANRLSISYDQARYKFEKSLSLLQQRFI